MAKAPTLSDVGNIMTSATIINENWDAIQEAFENTLSLDGSTPNAMLADLDLNDNDLLNVGTMDAELVRAERLEINGSDIATLVGRAETAADNSEDSEEAAANSASVAEQAAVAAYLVANSAATLLRNPTITSTGIDTYSLEHDLPVGLVFIDGVQQNFDVFTHDQAGREITFIENVPNGSEIEVLYSAGTAAYSLLTFEDFDSLDSDTVISYSNTAVDRVATTRAEGFSFAMQSAGLAAPYIDFNGTRWLPTGGTVDIRQCGAKCDAVTNGAGGYVSGTDDSAALQLAFDIAENYGMKVVGPANKTCLIRSNVLAWRVRVINLGQLDIVSDNNSQLAFGGFSESGGSPDWKIGNVTNGDNLLSGPVPSVAPFRMYGAKRGSLHIGNTNCLELYANNLVTGANANAYMNIYGNGVRRCDRITDNAASSFSWNTANKFHGGDVIELILIGNTYPHNDNEWFDNTFEGANVGFTFNYAQNNKVYRARLEGAAGNLMDCSNNAYGNVIEGANTSTGATRGLFENPLTLVEDASSRSNVLTTEAVTQWQKTLLFDVSPSVITLANATDWCSESVDTGPSLDPYSPPVVSPDLFGTDFTSFDTVALSKMVPVQRGDTFGFDVEADESGGAFLRPIFYGFDENFKSVSSSWLSYNGASSATSDGRSFVSTSTNVGVDTIRNNKASVETDAVAYVRVGLISYGAGFIKHASAFVYGRPLGFERHLGAVASKRLPSIAGVPTKGFAPVGYTALDSVTGGLHVAAFAHETFVDGAVASGADVVVHDATGVAVNDVVGVTLATNRTHWTTVSAVSGTTITLAAAAVLEDGARIVFNRWTSTS